jgi:hypothetical protein
MTETLQEKGVDVRERVLEEFVAVLNIIEPENAAYGNGLFAPRGDSYPYPVKKEDIDYGYCKTYLARCGPRSGRTISFSINKSWFSVKYPENRLRVYIHELTHLKHYGQNGSAHSPRFWQDVAFHTMVALDRWDEIADVFDLAVDPDEFKNHVTNDPVGNTTDGRSQTPAEASEVLEEYLEDYNTGVA